MRTILSLFEGHSPLYPTHVRQTILERFSKRGGGKESEKFIQGKFFSNFYECYMYAAVLGLKRDYKLSFERKKENKFWEITNWKPKELVKYLFSMLLAKSEFSFIELENMEEEQLREAATYLAQELEMYAAGGFNIIESKIEEEPDFFDDQFAFIHLIRETRTQE